MGGEMVHKEQLLADAKNDPYASDRKHAMSQGLGASVLLEEKKGGVR
jgi:hypothetical protein